MSARGASERGPTGFPLGRPRRAGGPGTFQKATSRKPQLRDLGEGRSEGPGRERPRRPGHTEELWEEKRNMEGGRVRVPRRGAEPEVEPVA